MDHDVRGGLRQSMKSTYEYSGFLSTVLDKPDPALSKSKRGITFTAEDLAGWKTEDFPNAIEWRQAPVRKKVTEEGVELEGDFRAVTNIDGLSENDPRYWVPLSTIGIDDDRLPINTKKYPIIEITYRCTSEMAHPTWMWSYNKGSHFGALPKAGEWHTVARNVQHFGFPSEVENIVLRLYSATRSMETMEIAQVRFRPMSKLEKDATRKSLELLESHRPPQKFDVLDEFMPIGIYMDAVTSKRLADMLGISAGEYWELVLEDVLRRHHNAIALSNVDQLNKSEMKDLLKRLEAHDVKLVPRHDYPVGASKKDQKAAIEKNITPWKDSPAIFARTFSGEPIENNFGDVLAAKEMIEKADPKHPVAIVARYPNAYPMFAPFFAASGVGHFTSRQPWDIGEMVRTHLPVNTGQQFWVAAPAFMYPTQTPEWSTCPQMRLMVNQSFANGARGWFTYSYHNDPVWVRGRVQRTLTGPFLTFSDLWLELMQRMKRISALAPLFLQSEPEEYKDDWFTQGIRSDSAHIPAPGIPSISQFHQRGPDFSLYTTVSNNTRDMTSVNINIPKNAAANLEIYDLTEYITSHQWRPMERKRHMEMFPGQSQVLLVAEPERCNHWRDIIASRLIQIDLRKLRFHLELAHVYGLDYGPIESRFDRVRDTLKPEDLPVVHRAKDELINLIYDSPAIREAQSKMLEASSLLCACDGALCRLIAMGKRGRAEILGIEVLPLAKEITHMRLELNAGNADKAVKNVDDLIERAQKIVAKIRSLY